MPLFRISVHYDGKRYLVVVKKTFRYSNVFFYNHLCPYSVFRYIMMESGIKQNSEKKGGDNGKH
jgi:hypothetical protein